MTSPLGNSNPRSPMTEGMLAKGLISALRGMPTATAIAVFAIIGLEKADKIREQDLAREKENNERFDRMYEKQTQAIVDFQVAVAQLTMTIAEAVERFDNRD